MLPLVLALLVVSVLKLGTWTWLLPLLTFLLATSLLPFGFGNPHIARLARSLPPPGPATDCFLAQLTLRPRLRSGWRAMVDDADDIGWLCITESALEFHGDSVRLTLPLQQVRQVTRSSIGLRGLYLYPRVGLKVAELPQAAELWLAERSSWFLPSARSITERLCRKLQQPAQGAVGPGVTGQAAR